jgi:hypothetical protein
VKSPNITNEKFWAGLNVELGHTSDAMSKYGARRSLRMRLQLLIEPLQPLQQRKLMTVFVLIGTQPRKRLTRRVTRHIAYIQ